MTDLEPIDGSYPPDGDQAQAFLDAIVILCYQSGCYRRATVYGWWTSSGHLFNSDEFGACDTHLGGTGMGENYRAYQDSSQVRWEGWDKPAPKKVSLLLQRALRGRTGEVGREGF